VIAHRRNRSARAIALLVGVALASAACSDGDDENGADTSQPAETAAPTAPTTPVTTTPPDQTVPPTNPPTTAPVTSPPTTAPDATEPPTAAGIDVADIVGTLASDEFAGRNDGTDGWRLAQEYIAGQLAEIAEPAFADLTGLAGYIQEGPSVNVAGIIRGSELPEEYVVIGAHYDGLGDAGDGCRILDPATDTICNGAADNATGVATVLAVAHEIAESGPPRRSLLIAFWDREEDGLIGSADFLASPVIPTEQLVAYLNFDIQGANLLPSLRETTVMVGAETGGEALVTAALAATESSSLTTVALSLVFGQGRSDHANFVSAGVPSVFFTDANNGCYHTTRDDIAAVDFGKLGQQIATAVALTAGLLNTDATPSIVTDPPVATYADAVAMLGITQTGQPDIGLLAPAAQAAYEQYLTDLQRIVDEGEAAFDDADVGPLLGGAATLVSALAATECDGYIAEGG
jgi:Zn-dependent M28 family amino/carboxypeptidase